MTACSPQACVRRSKRDHASIASIAAIAAVRCAPAIAAVRCAPAIAAVRCACKGTAKIAPCPCPGMRS